MDMLNYAAFSQQMAFQLSKFSTTYKMNWAMFPRMRFKMGQATLQFDIKKKKCFKNKTNEIEQNLLYSHRDSHIIWLVNLFLMIVLLFCLNIICLDIPESFAIKSKTKRHSIYFFFCF